MVPEAAEASQLSVVQEPEPKCIKEESEQEPEEAEVPKELDTSMDMKPLFLTQAMLTGPADAAWMGSMPWFWNSVQDPTASALTIFTDPIFGLKQAGHACAGGYPAFQAIFCGAEGAAYLPNPESCFLLCPRLTEPHCVGDTLPGSRCTEKDGEMTQGDLGREGKQSSEVKSQQWSADNVYTSVHFFYLKASFN